jgi:predicted DNA-binding transcriptional regulator YafY
VLLLTALWQQYGGRRHNIRRTERLFQIIQILRSKRGLVTGLDLANELEVSIRTLYRDMAELIAQRVPIRGEAGSGYVLDNGYDMPPLMLTPDELEAAMLGAAWVAKRGDPSLARGARDLIAKISAAVPQSLRPILLDDGLRPISFKPIARERFDLGSLRRAVRERYKAVLDYQDGKGQSSSRTIWPIFIAYMEEIRIIVAWCELRQDFRHFRTDRINAVQVMDQRYAARPADLRAQWKALQKRGSRGDLSPLGNEVE